MTPTGHFVVPGLTLDEVLAAVKQPEGKRLYTELVRVAGELKDLIGHAEEEAAPAVAESSPPSPSAQWSSSRSAASGARNRAAILTIFDARPGEWIAPRELAAALGLDSPTTALGRALGILLREGRLEHNGGQRVAARGGTGEVTRTAPTPERSGGPTS